MADLKELLNLPADIDQKSANLLVRAIKENNKDGFDYLEFLVSVQKLRSMDLDDSTAMKSAFATASSFGLTKESLVSSGQFYISVLRKEYESFKEALSRQIVKKINEPEASIKKMTEEYDQIDKKIAELQKKKTLYKEKVDKMKATIDSNKKDLTEREERFNTAFNSIKTSIEEKITKIKEQL